jgi:hypothetical protein
MAKTVLIIGAGASQEANLPIGSDLMGQIATLLTFRDERRDDLTLRALQTWGENNGGMGPLLQAAQQVATVLRDSQAMSIDNFVDAHRGNSAIELCAKIAIARAILRAERGSTLFPDQQNGGLVNLAALHGTWYMKFAKLLRENCTAALLPQRLAQLTVIIFNYDRCFEHFLSHDLHRYYGMSLDEAEDMVKSIEIYHPYGTVGMLPRWCKPDQAAVPFGHEPDASALLKISGSIKTFAEQSVEVGLIQRMRDAVANASPLVFLGFAYWRMNLQLLLRHSGDTNYESHVCFGTALGMSKSNQTKLCMELAFGRSIREAAISLSDARCSEFVDEHQRWLSFA